MPKNLEQIARNIEGLTKEQIAAFIMEKEKNYEFQIGHLKKIKQTVGHELKNIGVTMVGVPSLLRKLVKKIENNCYEITVEDIDKLRQYSGMIEKKQERLMDIYEILCLETITPEQIRKNSRKINLEEISVENILEKELNIDEKELAVELYQDQVKGFPMTIRTHKGLLSATLQTLYINQIAHAPRGSVIRHLYTAEDRNVIMMFENLIGVSDEKYRKYESGIGMRIVDTFARELKGNLILYQEPRIQKLSQLRERFGNQEARDLEGFDLYGLKIEIPISEL